MKVLKLNSALNEEDETHIMQKLLEACSMNILEWPGYEQEDNRIKEGNWYVNELYVNVND